MWGPWGRVTAARGFGKPCNLLTDVNHLVKVSYWSILQFGKSVDSCIIDYL